MIFLRFYGIIKLLNQLPARRNAEKIMPNNKFSQISLSDIYEDVSTPFIEKKSEFVYLSENYINFPSLISYEFHHAFYGNIGRTFNKRPSNYFSRMYMRALISSSFIPKLVSFPQTRGADTAYVPSSGFTS